MADTDALRKKLQYSIEHHAEYKQAQGDAKDAEAEVDILIWDPIPLQTLDILVILTFIWIMIFAVEIVNYVLQS